VFVRHCGTHEVLQILLPHIPETIITPVGGAHHGMLGMSDTILYFIYIYIYTHTQWDGITIVVYTYEISNGFGVMVVVGYGRSERPKNELLETFKCARMIGWNSIDK